MSEKVDTRISPALDPETYRSIEGYDHVKQFVGTVMDAMTDVYDVLGRLHNARVVAEGNPAWKPEQCVLIVSKEADRHRQRVLQRFDRADRDLGANIAHVEKQLMEPLTERAGLGTLNGEVRAFVLKLDRSGREKFMKEALERDDVPTLEAVLGAQPFLSGFTQLDHDHYLRVFHSKKRPDLVQRLDVLKRFRAKLDGIGPVLHTQFEKAIGAKPGVAGAIQRADERAKAALNIEPII